MIPVECPNEAAVAPEPFPRNVDEVIPVERPNEAAEEQVPRIEDALNVDQVISVAPDVNAAKKKKRDWWAVVLNCDCA